MNAASMFSTFVSTNSRFLAKQAIRMSNRILTIEDCLQELYLKAFMNLSNQDDVMVNDSEDLRFKSLRSVLINFVSDKIRASIVRDDSRNVETLESTSVSANASEEESGSIGTFDHYLSSSSCENEVSTKIFIETALTHLEKYEEKLPGIMYFFQELVEPSPETGDKFNAYRESLQRQRNMKEGYIPMVVLGRILEFDSNVVWKFEKTIKHVMKTVFNLNADSLALS